jgi:hypothetical protein
MSASGFDVPGRDRALDPATPLAHWASTVRISPHIATWLQARLADARASPAANAIIEALAGTEPTSVSMIGAKFDLAP